MQGGAREHFTAVERRLLGQRQQGDLGRLGPCRFEPMVRFVARKFTPVAVTSRAPARVVAIGDVHGDLAAFLAMLFIGGCIDSAANWVGGATHVVQVGDFLDSGGRVDGRGRLISVSGVNPREEIDIMQYAWALDCAARKVGGRVTLLAGNHELANFTHDFAHTTDVANKGWGGAVGRAQWFARGRNAPLARYFALRHPVIVTLGDLVFVHGGLSEPCGPLRSFADYVAAANAAWTDFLAGAPARACDLRPLYTRAISDGFAGTPAECATAADLHAAVHLPRNAVVIVGHTPQIAGRQPIAGVNGVCDDTMWRVDVAPSRAFGDTDLDARIQCLEITATHFRVLRQVPAAG
jgi:hypothetical protein